MQETMKSTWTASYSVSSQGASPIHAPQEVSNTEVEPIEPLSEPTEHAIVVEDTPAESAVEPVVEAAVVTDETVISETVSESEPVVVEPVESVQAEEKPSEALAEVRHLRQSFVSPLTYF